MSPWQPHVVNILLKRKQDLDLWLNSITYDKTQYKNHNSNSETDRKVGFHDRYCTTKMDSIPLTPSYSF